MPVGVQRSAWSSRFSRTGRDVNPESNDSVVAVVMPGGRAVFVVAPYKERALAKANVLAELAAKEAREERREFKPVEPQVFLFATPAELFAAARLPDGQASGQSILTRGRRCGRLVSESDSGCKGSDVKIRHWPGTGQAGG